MATLPNIENHVPAMTSDSTALEDHLPAIQKFQDSVFSTVASTTGTFPAWFQKYGKLLEAYCVADGATVSLLDTNAGTAATHMGAVNNTLSNPSGTNKTVISQAARDAYNIWKDTDANGTYTRLMKSLTALYFTFYAKNKIK